MKKSTKTKNKMVLKPDNEKSFTLPSVKILRVGFTSLL